MSVPAEQVRAGLTAIGIPDHRYTIVDAPSIQGLVAACLPWQEDSERVIARAQELANRELTVMVFTYKGCGHDTATALVSSNPNPGKIVQRFPRAGKDRCGSCAAEAA